MMIRNNNQCGFSAIMAVVFIVLFALIGTYLATFVTVSGLNTAASSREIQSWFAARSGLEWSVHTALNQSCTCATDCCSGTTFPIGSANAISLTGTGLNGYEFYLNSCNDASATEGSSTYCVYNVDLTARSGTEGDVDYTVRNMTISFTDRNAP